MSYDPDVTRRTYEILTLHALHYYMQEAIDERQLPRNMRWDYETQNSNLIDTTARTIVGRLRAVFYGNVLVDVDERFPKDWWEAVKDRFAPAWALRRWPVRYTTFKFKLADFPMNLPLADKYGPVLRVAVHDSRNPFL